MLVQPPGLMQMATRPGRLSTLRVLPLPSYSTPHADPVYAMIMTAPPPRGSLTPIVTRPRRAESSGRVVAKSNSHLGQSDIRSAAASAASAVRSAADAGMAGAITRPATMTANKPVPCMATPARSGTPARYVGHRARHNFEHSGQCVDPPVARLDERHARLPIRTVCLHGLR